MTISYTHLSHTAGWVGGLMRLLFLWKGSLFKQVWPDFLVFFGVYFGLSAVYRFVFKPNFLLILHLSVQVSPDRL